ILYSRDDCEIPVADPRSSGETEKSWVKRAKIHVTEVAKRKLQWWKDFILVERMFSLLEMLDFDGISAAFITRRHAACFEWAETERALDFLHVTDSRGGPTDDASIQADELRRARTGGSRCALYSPFSSSESRSTATTRSASAVWKTITPRVFRPLM